MITSANLLIEKNQNAPPGTPESSSSTSSALNDDTSSKAATKGTDSRISTTASNPLAHPFVLAAIDSLKEKCFGLKLHESSSRAMHVAEERSKGLVLFDQSSGDVGDESSNGFVRRFAVKDTLQRVLDCVNSSFFGGSSSEEGDQDGSSSNSKDGVFIESITLWNTQKMIREVVDNGAGIVFPKGGEDYSKLSVRSESVKDGKDPFSKGFFFFVL